MTLIEKMARAMWPDAQMDYVGKEQAERQARAALAVVCEALREPSEELIEIARHQEGETGDNVWPKSAIRNAFAALAAYLEGEGK